MLDNRASGSDDEHDMIEFDSEEENQDTDQQLEAEVKKRNIFLHRFHIFVCFSSAVMVYGFLTPKYRWRVQLQLGASRQMRKKIIM